jgi:hypothetical protein
MLRPWLKTVLKMCFLAYYQSKKPLLFFEETLNGWRNFQWRTHGVDFPAETCAGHKLSCSQAQTPIGERKNLLRHILTSIP